MKKEIQTNLSFIVLLTVVIILTTSLFTTCKEEEPEQSKDQSATITGLFDNNSSATVKGYLTDTEWAGVPDKIKSAFNGAFDDNFWDKDIYRSIFARSAGVTIIVEKNPTYTNWKIIGDGVTLYLNFNALDNIQSKLDTAIFSMNASNTETANVIFKYDQANILSTFLS